jgi:hypothetical protein
MEKRYLGILIDSTLYKGIPFGKTGHECLHYYEEAGARFDLIPSYFRLQDIKHEQDIIVAFVKKANGYDKKRIPSPHIIHNRALHTSFIAKKRLKNLARNGKIIFNQWNRYDKLEIHRLLMLNPAIRPHLPETFSADLTIIKPNSSSIGRGIMKLERIGSRWEFIYPLHKTQRKITFSNSIPSILKSKLKSMRYIIQQRLPLAKYSGRPFDLRVSVQRNINGGWQVTGIIGKVAAEGAFVTNIAQGGTVYPLVSLVQQYPNLNYEKVYDKITGLSLLVALQVSMYLPSLADLGLDIGLTECGFPMFIECNGRDLRYCFQKGHMIDIWKSTYTNPMGYARYLMDQRTKK